MASVFIKRPHDSDRVTPIRTFVLRSVIEAAVGFAIADAVVALLFRTGGIGWWVLVAAELLFLAVDVAHSAWTARQAMQPLEHLRSVAAQMKENALETSDLHRLAQELEQVDVHSLARQVVIAGAGQEIRALSASIGDMLLRIDRGYQAQAQFVSNASHELRTPIAVVQCFSGILRDAEPDDTRTQAVALEKIDEAAHDLEELVRRLTMLARQDPAAQSAGQEPVELSVLVRGIAREARALYPDYTVVDEIERGIAVLSDEGRIKECVRGFVDNAHKYTPAGGTLTIGLTLVDDREARISVRDTGCGISDEDLPHIFERFYRADRARTRGEGSGLGLSLAQGIAEKLHGRIEVESAPEQGSCFTLVLPVVPEENA